jgi:hypothetical protein
MNKQKLLIFSLVLIASLSFGSNVFAVRMVPEKVPLQPLPANTFPNVSNNINTKDSEANKALQAESEVAEENEVIPETETPPVPEVAFGSIQPSTQSIATYWTLLIFGTLGLILAALWAYFRFFRKGK